MTPATGSDTVLPRVENRVATLTFHRPDKLNALNEDLIHWSIRSLKLWADDPEVGAIVVTGAGRAFCAGGDVSAMAKDRTARSSSRSIACVTGRSCPGCCTSIPR